MLYRLSVMAVIIGQAQAVERNTWKVGPVVQYTAYPGKVNVDHHNAKVVDGTTANARPSNSIATDSSTSTDSAKDAATGTDAIVISVPGFNGTSQVYTITDADTIATVKSAINGTSSNDTQTISTQSGTTMKQQGVSSTGNVSSNALSSGECTSTDSLCLRKSC